MVSWLDRLQRRNRAAGFAIAVVYKYVDDQGGYLARHVRPDPIRSRVRSLMLLLLLGSALTGATLLSALGRESAAVGVNAMVCLVAFRVTTSRQLTFRQIAPGAVTAAVIWQLLQYFGWRRSPTTCR